LKKEEYIGEAIKNPSKLLQKSSSTLQLRTEKERQGCMSGVVTQNPHYFS